MIDDIAFEEALGPKRFLAWSKENELWRTFYRTHIAGHWSKNDVEEFNQCQLNFNFLFDHSLDQDAHTFCMKVMERCDDFKAAKVSKIAISNTKVIVLLGKSKKIKDKIASVARSCGFELDSIRNRASGLTNVELGIKSKFDEYLGCLTNAFAPNAAARAKGIH